MPVTDLLIHVSAPCTKRADDRYRAMALAYNAFKPIEVHNISTLLLPELVNQEDSPVSRVESRNSEFFARLPGYNIASSPPPNPVENQTQNHEVATSANRHVSTRRSSSSQAREQTLPETEYIEDTPHAVLALESQLLTSSLRALGAVDEDEDEDDVEDVGEEEQETAEQEDEDLSNGGRKEPDTTLLVAAMASSNGNQALVHDKTETREKPNGTPHKRCPSSPSPLDAPNEPHKRPRLSSPPHLLSPPAKTIHPPLPPASNSETPPTPLTPLLTTLLGTPSLSTRYNPLSQTRLLRPLERGYWLVPSSAISTWDAGLKGDFWTCLEESVGGGGAGWGVWCWWGGRSGSGGVGGGSRNCDGEGEGEGEVDGEGEGDGDGEWNAEGGGKEMEGDIRIYTFGGAAQAVYLLLFVASRSKIRRAEGVRWFDGRGDAVVTMS